jgi:hypothetical protein
MYGRPLFAFENPCDLNLANDDTVYQRWGIGWNACNHFWIYTN